MVVHEEGPGLIRHLFTRCEKNLQSHRSMNGKLVELCCFYGNVSIEFEIFFINGSQFNDHSHNTRKSNRYVLCVVLVVQIHKRLSRMFLKRNAFNNNLYLRKVFK